CRRWPFTTLRTAWARRKTRASLVCLRKVSKVGSACSGKWSLRVRIVVVSGKNYYNNSQGGHAPLILLSEQNLFDSNFSGAAYIVLEQAAQARDHDTWQALMEPALAGLNCRVIQATSDEAPGLLAYVAQHLGAHHSPDLFHVQHELSKAVTAPL